MEHGIASTGDAPPTPPEQSAGGDRPARVHESVPHRRIHPDAWEEIYVVGDVHGCFDELGRLIERLDPGPEDLLVFVGDLVRKGPDSAAVVEFVRRHENMVSVRGNNEDKLIHDRETLSSLDGDDLAYLESQPVALSLGESLVVHGGVDPTRPLAEQEVRSLLTCRSIPPENGYDGPFWFERYRGPPRTFFGHTVLEEPIVTDWAVGLDTGCVYGGSLTAYDYRRERTVSVPARRAYESRPEGKVLAPGVVEG